jgi:predicted transcriptional regulator
MTPKPNASLHNPSTAYLRSLIEQAGLSQQAAADAVGISARAMRSYLSDNDERQAPYAVQYALEQLARKTR